MTSPISFRVAPASAAEPDTVSRSNRKAVLGLVLLAGVLAAVCVWFLRSTGPDVEALESSPPAVVAQPDTGRAAEPSPAPPVVFTDAEQVRNGRNPFEVLHAAPTGGRAAPGGPADVPATADLPPVDPPRVPGATGGAGTGRVLRPVPAAGAPARPVLALVRTDGTWPALTAVLAVDGVEQAVAVGDSFGPSADLLLLSLQEGPGTGEWTAVVQRGQGDPFDVVSGTPVPLP